MADGSDDLERVIALSDAPAGPAPGVSAAQRGTEGRSRRESRPEVRVR